MSIIAGRACGARVVWGVRSSDLSTGAGIAGRSRVCSRAGALLSRLSRSHHHQFAMRPILSRRQRATATSGSPSFPTASTLNCFRSRRSNARAVRREWMCVDDEILVGRAARFDPLEGLPVILASGRPRQSCRTQCQVRLHRRRHRLRRTARARHSRGHRGSDDLGRRPHRHAGCLQCPRHLCLVVHF